MMVIAASRFSALGAYRSAEPVLLTLHGRIVGVYTPAGSSFDPGAITAVAIAELRADVARMERQLGERGGSWDRLVAADVAAAGIAARAREAIGVPPRIHAGGRIAGPPPPRPIPATLERAREPGEVDRADEALVAAETAEADARRAWAESRTPKARAALAGASAALVAAQRRLSLARQEAER